MRFSKYGNTKCYLDGIKFDSLREQRHYIELKLRVAAKEIRDLTLQPEFVLVEGGKDRAGKKIRPIIYRADFMYFDRKTGATVVVDVKGMRTPVYILKSKMFRLKFPEYKFEEV